jgi:hypothetical protein
MYPSLSIEEMCRGGERRWHMGDLRWHPREAGDGHHIETHIDVL